MKIYNPNTGWRVIQESRLLKKIVDESGHEIYDEDIIYNTVENTYHLVKRHNSGKLTITCIEPTKHADMFTGYTLTPEFAKEFRKVRFKTRPKF